MCTTFVVVMVSQVYATPLIHPVVYIKYIRLLIFNQAPIILFKIFILLYEDFNDSELVGKYEQILNWASG